MYHNTTHLSGNELIECTVKAEALDEIIHRFFQNRPNQELTGCQVYALLKDQYPGLLITSVRRSIDTLIREDKLYCTGRKVKGLYGSPAFLRRLKTRSDMQIVMCL